MRSCILTELCLKYCTYVTITLYYIFQRTLEQSKARRKKRRYMKRLAAKKDVPPTIAAVSYGHQSHSKKLEEENANYKLVCYKKYKEKYMGEVDEMLMESMKKKSQERMKASEEYVDSDNGSDNNEPINEVDKSTRTDCKKCEVNNAYIKLVKRSLSEIENNCSSSLLLPAIVQPSEQITVHVQSGNNEVEKVAVEECIKNLVGERDAAMKTVRYLRNQVEDLQSRNRKIYCEMNDKIDTVRNFWRNRLVEGDTRSGMCVKLAIQRNVS